MRLPLASVGAACALSCASPAAAEPALDLSGSYTIDISGPVSGGQSRAGRALDNLLVSADTDLATLADWQGANAHVSVLSNAGGKPNDLAGTLQGIDNIEVARPRPKLFEAWVEQTYNAASLRLGLYDLNSEFYTTDAAGLLISPSFGVGSELAATGPNGPSIFPSTALAARLRFDPRTDAYVQAAVLGAKAGVLGDPGGIDTSFDSGLLYIGEAGWMGFGKIALGGWRYSRRQPKIFSAVDAKHKATGAYALLNLPLSRDSEGPRAVSAFVRLGVSDGQTTSFRGGGQAGVLVNRVFASRPHSMFSAGFSRGLLSTPFRADLTAGGAAASHAESAAEMTYADRVGERIMLQPSLQYVADAGGDRAAKAVVVLTLRTRITFN